MTIGLVSSTLLLQTVAIVIHSLNKQKLFVVILNVFAIGVGAAGGTLQNLIYSIVANPFEKPDVNFDIKKLLSDDCCVCEIRIGVIGASYALFKNIQNEKVI